MLSVAKLATPLTAATVVVPVNVAPLVPVPAVSVRVTFWVKPGTGRPPASSAVTWTAGVIWWPAVVVVGSTLNASWVGTVGPVGPRSHVARNSEDTRSAAPGSSRAPSAVEGARMVVAIGQCSWTYISFPRLGLRNSHWRWENG